MTGKALRSIRLALNLSLPQFAEQIGLTVAELDAFERGDLMLDAGRLVSDLERLRPHDAASPSGAILRPLDAPERAADSH